MILIQGDPLRYVLPAHAATVTFRNCASPTSFGTGSPSERSRRVGSYGRELIPATGNNPQPQPQPSNQDHERCRLRNQFRPHEPDKPIKVGKPARLAITPGRPHSLRAQQHSGAVRNVLSTPCCVGH